MAGLKELIEKTSDMKESFMIASYTDRVCIDIWNPDKSPDDCGLLELRVFNKEKEVLLFRTSIGKQFIIRERDDSDPHFDEVQVLDIDTKATEEIFAETGLVHTITAGTYPLPASVGYINNPGIRIRHYFGRYPDSGRAYIKDWRCVNFEPVPVETKIIPEDSEL